jgi:hypothetical protein
MLLLLVNFEILHDRSRYAGFVNHTMHENGPELASLGEEVVRRRYPDGPCVTSLLL